MANYKQMYIYQTLSSRSQHLSYPFASSNIKGHHNYYDLYVLISDNTKLYLPFQTFTLNLEPNVEMVQAFGDIFKNIFPQHMSHF